MSTMNAVPGWGPMGAVGTGGSTLMAGVLLSPPHPLAVMILGAAVTLAGLAASCLTLITELARIRVNGDLKRQVIAKAEDVEHIGPVLLAVEGLAPGTASLPAESPPPARADLPNVAMRSRAPLPPRPPRPRHAFEATGPGRPGGPDMVDVRDGSARRSHP